MNLLAGHSTQLPLAFNSLCAFAPTPLTSVSPPPRPPVDRDPVILGPTPRLRGKLKLDGGLLLSECNPDAFLAGRARHACRLLVLWLLQAGAHRVVDRC